MSSKDDTRWSLVCHRIASDFLYAVTTMRIYCRPGCPSPLPKRTNTMFFDNVADAERAGFRACKRCDPKGERGALIRAVVEDACSYIQTEEAIPSLDVLARRAGYSRFHFLRMFQELTGLTPRRYAEGIRAQRLRTALSSGARVADAVAEAGFGSESRVYEDTGALLGMTPGAFRRGGQGERISSAAVDSPFGRLLVAATVSGICFLGFSEPDEVMRAELRRRFPHAEIVDDDQGLATMTNKIIAFMDEPVLGLDLPLDLRGTAFQLRVWEALRHIPVGETRSYGELATIVGSPKSARAVARSCADNPVALAIPCHRVISQDGSISGYRWGVPRKRALLARETAATQRLNEP